MNAPTTMRYGIFDQVDDTGRPLNIQYEQRMQLGELYDRHGFHCYHQSEHHATPLNMAPSQSVFLAAMAQRTRNIRLCPLVYLLPIHHPLRLAEEICMLDHLSNGRLEFGIGRGASPYELDAHGIPPESSVQAYAESYAVVQKCFTSETLDHVGKFWTFKDVPLTMKPFQLPHPPMWYAAANAESAIWPARNGVHIICGGPIDKVHLISESYRAEAAKAGEAARTDACIGVSRFVVVAETDEQAMQIAQSAWPRFYESFYKLWRKHGTEPARLKLATDFAGMVESGQGVAGSPETVAKELTRQARLGHLNYIASQFMFGDMAHDDAMKSVGLFAQHVIPSVTATSSEWI